MYWLSTGRFVPSVLRLLEVHWADVPKGPIQSVPPYTAYVASHQDGKTWWPVLRSFWDRWHIPWRARRPMPRMPHSFRQLTIQLAVCREGYRVREFIMCVHYVFSFSQVLFISGISIISHLASTPASDSRGGRFQTTRRILSWDLGSHTLLRGSHIATISSDLPISRRFICYILVPDPSD